MVRTLMGCALLLLASLVPRAARSAEDPRAEASAHYARGIELAEQALYATALAQFKAAYDKSPHFAVLYNIGQAQIALGRPVEAIEALSRYLRGGADQVPLSRREQVQAQIALLESRPRSSPSPPIGRARWSASTGARSGRRRSISRSGRPPGRTQCRSRWTASPRSSRGSTCGRAIVRRSRSSSRPGPRRRPRHPAGRCGRPD